VGVYNNCRATEILDKKLASVSAGDNTFNSSCHHLDHLKDISDCSEASAPDNAATAECSKQHDKRAQM